MKRLLISLINFYQIFLSFDKGLLRLFAPGGACRFKLSCSEYTKRAIKKDGVIIGLLGGVKRVLSCQPFIP